MAHDASKTTITVQLVTDQGMPFVQVTYHFSDTSTQSWDVPVTQARRDYIDKLSQTRGSASGIPLSVDELKRLEPQLYTAAVRNGVIQAI